MLSVLKTEMNYLQNNYNISHHFLKTSLHYRVKHKVKKCCSCSIVPIFDDKAVPNCYDNFVKWSA